MTDFLFLLAKVNLAMAAAIVVVALLRRPVRAAFHARIAYGLWLLVPVGMLASLLPARVVAAAAHSAGAVIPLAFQAAPARLASVAAQSVSFDWNLVVLIGWVIGMTAMALMMARQQQQFHKAEQRGAAGPAVTGFLRPRIVVPTGFTAQFSVPEQAAILAHEAAHLARQDARVNAVVAGLRCVCWFNPLAHMGALWLRKDQELACDAAALMRVPRIDYANALLKSQMRAMALPVGCSWPGGEHPLTERVELLKQTPPARARQAAGIALVLSLTVFAGVGAWAVEPAQVAPSSPAAKSFSGKFFYTNRDGASGPTFFMTLESVQGEKKHDDPWSGHVALHFPYGMAQADSASLDWAVNKSIILNGDIMLWAGSHTLRGQKLTFDAYTGMLNLDGKTMPSGIPKCVPGTNEC